MSTLTAIRSRLASVPVIGIIRGCPPENLVAVAEAAVEGGVAVIEVTLDSPNALDGIARLVARGDEAFIGAGTVRTRQETSDAVSAGARFVVSPIVSTDVIDEARRQGVDTIPGAATPTEIWLAVTAGAAAVKVFPVATLGGAEYLKAVGAPLGHPPLLATGGVDVSNARALLEAGAFAIGVGGSIFSSEAMSAGDTHAVKRAAEDIVAEVRR